MAANACGIIGTPTYEYVPEPDQKYQTSDTISPTKGGSRLEMLGNLGGLGGSVKSQMSSWLGGGIPGLNKKPEAAEGDAPADAAATTPPAKSPSKEKDDDASRPSLVPSRSATSSTPLSIKPENQSPRRVPKSRKPSAGPPPFRGLGRLAVCSAGENSIDPSPPPAPRPPSFALLATRSFNPTTTEIVRLVDESVAFQRLAVSNIATTLLIPHP
ncbi:unnamed protein product [Nesidiocoris tenuis]|uniref:Uncharacterized protein n=1 Tax=Nesidiocoris tenuis TaxID=355587 RepID=A0A6H5H2K6_9HEMI|nr:unnamed protein product [Nesidiocoris tenuis]